MGTNTKDVKFILSFDDKGTAILKKATKGATKELGRFKGGAKEAEKALKKFTATQTGTAKGMGKLKGMLKSTWGQMAMGMGVMTGITGIFRSVSRAITSTIQTGREFQKSWANTTTMMTVVEGKIEGTTMSLDDMKKQLLEMNPLLGGAKGLSDGLYQVLSASVPAGEALEFLGVASKSAMAGMTDITTSVDALTTVFNAYGQEAYSVTEISDIMFQTVKLGKLTYESLAGALGTIVPIASQVGVSFEEVAGAMATMTRQGIDVNTSTVALRQTLVSVLKPTKDAMDTARRLGIDFTSAGLKAKGFAGWLQDVSDKAGGSVDDMTALFGNVRALMGVFALAGDKIEDYVGDVKKMIQAVKDGTVTHEAFVKQLQNTGAMLDILKTIVGKMQIAIWEGMSKPFQKAILDTENVSDSMEKLQKQALEFGDKLGQSIGKAIKFIVDFKDVIVSVGKMLVLFWATKKITVWANVVSVSMLKAKTSTVLFGNAVKMTGKMMKLMGKGIAVVAVFMAGWELGKWIGKVFKLNIALSHTAEELENIKKFDETFAGKGHIEAQTKRLERLAVATKIVGEEVTSIQEAHRILLKTWQDTGDLGTEALNKWAEGLSRLNVNTAIITTGAETLKDVVKKSLEVQVEAFAKLVKVGKLSYKESILQLKDLMEQYAKAKIDIPDSLNAVADALQDQIDKIAEAKQAYKSLLATYRQTLPSIKDIKTQTRALSEVIAGYVAQGGDATAITQLFAKQINTLYGQAEQLEGMFKIKIPEALQKLKDGLKGAGDETEVLKARLFNLKLPEIDFGKPEEGAFFEGINEAGEKVWMSLEKVRKAGVALGLVFKRDMRIELARLEEGFEDAMTSGDLFEGSQVDMIMKIKALYENLQEDVPEKYKKMLDELDDYTKGTTTDLMASFDALGKLIGGLGGQIGGDFGKLISGVGVAVQQAVQAVKQGVSGIGDILGAIAPMLGQIGGQIGEMISGVEDSFASLGASIGGTIGGMFGPLGSAIGSIAGGLLGGLFGKGEKKTEEQRKAEQLEQQIKDMTKAMSKFGEITESTAKMIADSTETMEGFVAVSLHFDQVIRDVGVTQENINDLWSRTTDILHHVKDGFLGVEDGTDALNRAFDEMIRGARKLGLEGSEGMREFIETARELGIEIESVNRYVLDQLDAIPSELARLINRIRVKFKGEDPLLEGVFPPGIEGRFKKRLDNFAQITATTFQAMIASGRSYVETVKAMKEPLEALIEKYEQLGEEVPAFLQPMKEMVELMERRPKIFENLDSSLAILNSLKNTSYMTQGAFDALSQSLKAFAKALLGVDGNLNKALKTMKLAPEQVQALLPSISQFVGVAGMFGLAIPEWMKTFVETQMEGVKWEDFVETVTAQANSGINTVEKLKTLIETTKNQGKARQRQLDRLGTRFEDAIGGLGDRLSGAIEDSGNGTDNGRGKKKPGEDEEGGGGRGDEWTGAQGGFEGRVNKDVQPFLAHKGEFVKVWTPEESRGGGLSGAGSGAGDDKDKGSDEGTNQFVYSPTIFANDVTGVESALDRTFDGFVRILDVQPGKRATFRKAIRVGN